MVFLLVQGFRLSLPQCLSFQFMLLICSFWLEYTVILMRRGALHTMGHGGDVAEKSVYYQQCYTRGEVCFAQRAREELWRENISLTTTAAQLCRGLSDGRCMESQGLSISAGYQWYWRWTEQWVLYIWEIPGYIDLIASSHTTSYTFDLSHLLISLALSKISWIHEIGWTLSAGN